MNDRIKALMLEAGYAAPEIALRAQKLAELIVTECAMIANRLENDEFWVEPAYDVITKHFGIE
jgi:hypothetical protein